MAVLPEDSQGSGVLTKRPVCPHELPHLALECAETVYRVQDGSPTRHVYTPDLDACSSRTCPDQGVQRALSPCETVRQVRTKAAECAVPGVVTEGAETYQRASSSHALGVVANRTFREPSTLGRALEEVLRPLAKERQREHGDTAPGRPANTSEKVTGVSGSHPQVADEVADVLGTSRCRPQALRSSPTAICQRLGVPAAPGVRQLPRMPLPSLAGGVMYRHAATAAATAPGAAAALDRPRGATRAAPRDGERNSPSTKGLPRMGKSHSHVKPASERTRPERKNRGRRRAEQSASKDAWRDSRGALPRHLVELPSWTEEVAPCTR